MQTIRQGVFETNSSSTHAVSICYAAGSRPTCKPFSDSGDIVVRLGGCYDDESWKAKAGLLAHYLRLKGRDEEIGKIATLLSDFSGMNISFDKETLEKITPITKESTKNSSDDNEEDEEDEDEDWEDEEDELTDAFSFFIGEYSSHEDSEDFSKVLDGILGDDADIVGFICKEGCYDVESYYS